MTPVTLSLVVDRENAVIVSKFLLELFPAETQSFETAPPKAETESPKQAKPKPKPEPKPESPVRPETEKPKGEEREVSLSDVRAKALLLSKAGKQETLKKLFEKHGGSKLSEIVPDKYNALLADMEAEING